MRTLKRLWDGLKRLRTSPKKFIITVVLGATLIALSLYSYEKRMKTGIDYRTILEETAISVDGNERTFREIALYVAYEEATVEEQAIVYNPENPGKYWNVHTDGTFIRLAARNAAAQMALHDEVFYQMALKEEIELNEEEKETLLLTQEDVWNDLTDDAKDERLGITREDIDQTVERMMYAQKMQLIYANIKDLDYEKLAFAEEEYEKLQENYETSINKKYWEQLQFGEITISHR